MGSVRMEADVFGWREGILLLVGLAVVYLLLTLFRLLRVGKGVETTLAPAKAEPPMAATGDNESIPELTEPVSPLVVSHSTAWNDVVDLELHTETGPATPEPAPRVTGFGEQLAEHLARSDLEREVRKLRQEVDELRAELDDLRSLRNISPHYAEALELAQRGLTAQAVADRMGISLAEAELVHALSQGERIFEEGEEDGAEPDGRDDRNPGDDRFEPGIGYAPRRPG